MTTFSQTLSTVRSNYVAGSVAGLFPGRICGAARHSGASRNPAGGELDSGSRPAALPGMTQKRTRYVFRALCLRTCLKTYAEAAEQDGPLERNARYGNGLGIDGYRLPGTRPLWGY
jgi:hypothetical protein